MTENFPAIDRESDRLITILTDENSPKVARIRATEQLYHRHSAWVLHNIGRRIYNPDDVQDIAQAVWMLVLDPARLKREYVNHNGKFRAYLQNPIRWSILKHIQKLPYRVDESGEKSTATFTSLDDSLFDESLTGHRVYQMIEHIIKPHLKQLGLKVRNVYMLNEYDVIFNQAPTVNEMANINGITESHASDLLHSASTKQPNQCDDEEISVHVPVNYESIVDRSEIDRNSSAYLSGIIGVSDAAYRKRLHTGRKLLLQTVREQMLPDTLEDVSHG